MKAHAYSRIENGVGRISEFVKKQLASLYGKDPEYFADDLPEPESESEPEPIAEPETSMESEVVAEQVPDTEFIVTKTVFESISETEEEPEPTVEPEAELEPINELVDEPVHESVDESESTTESETDPEPVVEYDPDLEPIAELEIIMESKAVAEPETSMESEAIAEQASETENLVPKTAFESVSGPEHESESESAVKPIQLSEPEPAIASEPMMESEMGDIPEQEAEQQASDDEIESDTVVTTNYDNETDIVNDKADSEEAANDHVEYAPVKRSSTDKGRKKSRSGKKKVSDLILENSGKRQKHKANDLIIGDIEFQYAGKAIPYTDIVERARKACKNKDGKLDIYVKPEENRVYYVCDGDAGSFEI